MIPGDSLARRNLTTTLSLRRTWPWLTQRDGTVPPWRPFCAIRRTSTSAATCCEESKPKGFKTYHDLLEYEDDDAPVSNQGFHCGALMAARELGLPVTNKDIERAIAGYRAMFNAKGGYFPTSIHQPQHVGQDTLYGA